MFQGLDEQIKQDDMAGTTPRERVMKWVTIGVVAVALFGGLYYGLRMLDYVR